MKTQELVKFLKEFITLSFSEKNKATFNEVIQRLREYDELKTILHRILDELEEAYLVYNGDPK